MSPQYFVGKKPVLQIVDVGRTPMNLPMLKVCFEDGTYEYMPEKRFNIVKTTEKTDESYVKGMVVAHASKDVGSVIYSMLLEMGCKLSEVESVTNQAIVMTNAASERANNILWGIDYADERTINQINDILVKNVTKTDNNGAASDGAGSDTSNTK